MEWWIKSNGGLSSKIRQMVSVALSEGFRTCKVKVGVILKCQSQLLPVPMEADQQQGDKQHT
jgi:hypothetical protein